MLEGANWGPPPTEDIELREATRWAEAAGRPFLFEGGWWTLDAERRVGKWDAERGAWTTPDPLTVPFFMRRPPYMDLGLVARILRFALLTFVFSTVITLLIGDIRLIRHLDGIAEGALVQDLPSTRSFLLHQGIVVLFFLAIAPLFIWWTYLVAGNGPSFGASPVEPGFAAASWFLPVLQLFGPLAVLVYAWKVADPRLPRCANTEWIKLPSTRRLPVWWVVFLLSSLLWITAVIRWDADMTAPVMRDAMILVFISNVALLVSALLAANIVVSLSNRQEQAHQRFLDVPAGLDGIDGETPLAVTPPDIGDGPAAG